MIEYPIPRTVFENDEVIVVEQKPQLRTIKVSSLIYRLAFPYVQFYFPKGGGDLNYMMISFTSNPVKGLKSKVYHPLLPNIYDENYEVCIALEETEDITAKIEQFWSTEFTNACITGYGYLAETKLRNYSHWEELTLSDGLKALDLMELEKHSSSSYVAAIISEFVDLNEFSQSIQIAAVKGGEGQSLRQICNPSEKVQLAAVQADGSALQFIQNPSERVQLTAVNFNGGRILRFIYGADNPSEKVQLAAVQSDVSALEFIHNPSEKVQLAAARTNGCALEFIRNPSKNVELAAVKQNGHVIKHIANPSEEIQLAAVKQNGYAIKHIANPSEKVQLAAIRQRKEDESI